MKVKKYINITVIAIICLLLITILIDKLVIKKEERKNLNEKDKKRIIIPYKDIKDAGTIREKL
jgi:sporulation protein YlmC with PRC-barrel domain